MAQPLDQYARIGWVTEPQNDVLKTVADMLAGRGRGRRLRVGIDGLCGAGKSTFAVALVAAITEQGRPALRIDSDGFHHLRDRRYRQGRNSARGYYEDAYDFEMLIARVLEPLGPGGSGQYAPRVIDMATDSPVSEMAAAPSDAVVVFDATFLQRDHLRGWWDEVIYLEADEAVATARGVARDADALGGTYAAKAAYESRYMAACRIYISEQDPRRKASIVVDNTDLTNPVLLEK